MKQEVGIQQLSAVFMINYYWYNIQLYDNAGGSYAGKIGDPYSGTAQEAVWPFWANGTSGGDIPVQITGWAVRAGWILTIRANWVETDTGKVGYINAMGTGLAEY